MVLPSFFPADIFWHGRLSGGRSCPATSSRDHDQDLWPDTQTAVPYGAHQQRWTQTYNRGRITFCYGAAGTAGIQGEP